LRSKLVTRVTGAQHFTSLLPSKIELPALQCEALAERSAARIFLMSVGLCWGVVAGVVAVEPASEAEPVIQPICGHTCSDRYCC